MLVRENPLVAVVQPAVRTRPELQAVMWIAVVVVEVVAAVAVVEVEEREPVMEFV